MPRMLPIGPILRMASICSRKSSSDSSPVLILAAALAVCSSSKASSACSIRVSRSPMPRMREAIRSGWNTSKSASFSPLDANRIGWPVTSRTLSAAPPRASPSSLVSTTPVKPDAVAERLGGGHRVLTDHRVDHEQGLVGPGRVPDVRGLLHQLGVDAEPAGGVDDDHVVVLLAGVRDAAAGHVDRVADPVAGLRGEGRHPGPLADDLQLGDRVRAAAGRRPPAAGCGPAP